MSLSHTRPTYDPRSRKEITHDGREGLNPRTHSWRHVPWGDVSLHRPYKQSPLNEEVDGAPPVGRPSSEDRVPRGHYRRNVVSLLSGPYRRGRKEWSKEEGRRDGVHESSLWGKGRYRSPSDPSTTRLCSIVTTGSNWATQLHPHFHPSTTHSSPGKGDTYPDRVVWDVSNL